MEQIAVVTKENVSRYLKQIQNDAEVHIYHSFADLPELIDGKPFLAIYLDLDLLRAEGCDIPESVKRLTRRGRVILGASDPKLIPPLNTCHQFGELRKPFVQSEIDSMVADVKQVYCEENELLRFKANRAIVRIRYELIDYIISSGHSIVISTRGGTEKYRYRFADIETLLRDERFLKCNRGVIINMQNVVACDGHNFAMPDGTSFPIKNKSLNEIRSIYSNYCRNHEHGQE